MRVIHRSSFNISKKDGAMSMHARSNLGAATHLCYCRALTQSAGDNN
jgi:hypothetical protein